MKIRAIILLVSLLVASTAPAQSDDVALKADITEARKLIQRFAKELKGQLLAGMKEGGPVKAIDVCRVQAPEIALKASQSSGWRVARTSLKLRNPANEPDPWEFAALKYFEEQRAKGVAPKTLERAEITHYDGAPAFRYMKAIPTGGVCLNCHGAKLDPQVKKVLRQSYPDDQATGFSKGDIRGAFTLIKPLP